MVKLALTARSPQNSMKRKRRPNKFYIFTIMLTLMLIVMGATIAGCDQAEEKDANNNEQIKSVKVMEIVPGENPTALNYIGTVDSRELVKYSFKMPGQIKKIYVAEGDRVNKGDSLAELETTDLEFQLSAARATRDTATANVKKAREVSDYASISYERTNQLFEEGAVARDALDQVQLKKNTAESDLLLAKAQLAAAETDYNYKSDMLHNSIIYAKQDGYVAQKVFNENERINAYTPVIVVRNKVQVVNIGIPQQELTQIKVGSTATINVDNDSTEGIITGISELPDETTRTYKAEISIPESNFRLGSTAKVSVYIGNQSGIWIPMSCIFSYDGEDCVYLVDDGRAFKRRIEIQNISEDQALVTGLSESELLVTSGMNNLDDGTRVKVQQQEQVQE